MQERKIVLFLVEGTSDIEALEGCFDEIYEQLNIEFKPLRFDITADENSTRKNIEKLVIEKIDSFVDNHPELTHKDILEVIQIVDMDGAGVGPESVKQSDTGETYYTEENIMAKNVDRLKARNIRKRDNLYTLLRKTFLSKKDDDLSKQYELPYHVYFFSRNLEHALYNRSETFTKEEKEDLAIEFSDEYVENTSAFIKLLQSPELKIPGTYLETWQYIFEGTHSLHRGSNLHLIFEEIPFYIENL